MAGIGDMIASMASGAAENYATNRAGEIRDTEKATLADARETKLMAIKQQYAMDAQKDQQKFQGEQGEAERTARASEGAANRASSEKIAAGNNATSLAAANISASASRDNAETRAGAAGGGKFKGKQMQGTPVQEKDDMGNPTGRFLVSFKDGSQEIVTWDELPGGNKMTRAQKAERQDEVDAYVSNRLGEMSSIFTSDKEAFKDYGGSKEKAKKALEKEYWKEQESGDAGAGADTGSGNAPPVNEPENAAKQTAAETANMSPVAKSLVEQMQAANPDASVADIVSALSADKRYASYFK